MKKAGVYSRSFVKAVAYALSLYILYILQAMIFPHIKLFGMKPIILPVAVMAVAACEGAIRGGMYGLLAGILCDMSFDNPALQFTIFMTAMGLGAGYLFETMLENGILPFALCTTVALLLCAVIQSFSLLVYHGADIMAVLRTYLIQTGYSAVFIVPLYYIIRQINRITKQ